MEKGCTFAAVFRRTERERRRASCGASQRGKQEEFEMMRR